ncbi:hypothetical protein BGX21_006313, partial [Mortierella sp. AD011]
AQEQDSRLETRGIQATGQVNSTDSYHCRFCGKSNGDDDGSIPSEADVQTTHSDDQLSAEDGMQLDGPDFHQHLGTGRTEMVEEPPVQVERAIVHSPSDGCGHLYGLVRQPLGLSRQRNHHERNLDDTGTRSAYQLEGIEMHMARSNSTAINRTDGKHYFRQSDRHIVHQQVWRHQIQATVGPGHENLEVLPTDGNTPQDDVCSFVVQPGGRPLASDEDSTGMVNCSRILPGIGQDVGTTSRRSLCFTQEQESGPIRLLEAPSHSFSSGCPSTPMELVGTPMDMSALEFDTQDSTSNSGRENQGNIDNASMGRGVMVPDSQNIGDTPSSHNSTQQSLSRKRTLRQRARPEPNMGSQRLESRRSTLLAAGASENVTALICDSPSAIRRHKSYEQVQINFARFTEDNGRDPKTPDPISIMNYLAHGYFELGWATTTVFNYRSKILQLYDNTDAITSYPGYSSFMDAVAAAGVKRIRNIDIDLTP